MSVLPFREGNAKIPAEAPCCQEEVNRELWNELVNLNMDIFFPYCLPCTRVNDGSSYSFPKAARRPPVLPERTICQVCASEIADPLCT